MIQFKFPGAIQSPCGSWHITGPISEHTSLIIVFFVMTVETGRRFFPNCSEVLDRFLEDDMQETLLLEKGPPEEQSVKKMRYMELKDEVMKAFDKDKAERNWVSFSSASSCSSSPKASANLRVRKR